MEDNVVVINSDSEEDESKISVKNAKLLKRLWEKANPIVFHHLSSDSNLTFPYDKFKNFYNELKKTLSEPEFTIESTKTCIWNNLIQWLIAMKLSYSGVVDLKYDEKFNFILIDFMAEYINYKCKLNLKINNEYEIQKEINEILGILGIMFNGNSPYIVMTLIKIDVIEEYNNLLKPIFNKILSDKYAHKSKEFISYLELILCFKQYKKLARRKEEREAINEIAVGKSMKSLGKNFGENCTNIQEGILPLSVPPVDDTNRSFTLISELIGHAIKKGNFGTRILLIKKSLDLEEAIQKYFIQYERKINRCDPSTLCSLTNLLYLNDNADKTNKFDNMQKTSKFHENNFSSQKPEQQLFNRQQSLLGKQQHLSNVCDINTKLSNINKKNDIHRLDNKLLNYNKISNNRNISDSSIVSRKNNQNCDRNYIEEIIQINISDSSEENDDNNKNLTGITTKNNLRKSVPYKKSQQYKSKKIYRNNTTDNLLRNTNVNNNKNNNSIEKVQTILILSSDDEDNKIECAKRKKLLLNTNNNNISRCSSRNSSIPSESDTSISENSTNKIKLNLRKPPQLSGNLSPLPSISPYPPIQQQRITYNNNTNNHFSTLYSLGSGGNNTTGNIKKLDKQRCITGEVSSTTLLDYTISDLNDTAIASTSSAAEVHSASANYETDRNIREVGNIIKVNSPSILSSPFGIGNNNSSSKKSLNYSDISSDDEDDGEFSIARNLYSRIPKKYIREIEKAISSTSEINNAKGTSSNSKNNASIESSQTVNSGNTSVINQSSVIPQQNNQSERIQFSFTDNTNKNKLKTNGDSSSTDNKNEKLNTNSVNCLAVVPYSPVTSSNLNKTRKHIELADVAANQNLNVLLDNPNITTKQFSNLENINSELHSSRTDDNNETVLNETNDIPKQSNICDEDVELSFATIENSNKICQKVDGNLETVKENEINLAEKTKKIITPENTIEEPLNTSTYCQFTLNILDKNKSKNNNIETKINDINSVILNENKTLSGEIAVENNENSLIVISENLMKNSKNLLNEKNRLDESETDMKTGRSTVKKLNNEGLLPNLVTPSALPTIFPIHQQNDISMDSITKSIQQLPIPEKQDLISTTNSLQLKNSKSSYSNNVISKTLTIKSLESMMDKPLKTYSKKLLENLNDKSILEVSNDKDIVLTKCDPKTTIIMKEKKDEHEATVAAVLKESGPIKITEISCKQPNNEKQDTFKIKQSTKEEYNPLKESVPLTKTPIQLINKETIDIKTEKPLKTYSKKSTFIRRIHKIFDDKTFFKKYSKHSTTIKIVKNMKEPDIRKPLKTYKKAKKNNLDKKNEDETMKTETELKPLLESVDIDLHNDSSSEKSVDTINCELNFDIKELNGIINSPQNYENEKELESDAENEDIDTFDNKLDSENKLLGYPKNSKTDMFDLNKNTEQINIQQKKDDIITQNMSCQIELVNVETPSHKGIELTPSDNHANSLDDISPDLPIPYTQLIEIESTCNKNIDISPSDNENDHYEKLLEILSPGLSEPCTELSEIENIAIVVTEEKNEDHEKLLENLSSNLSVSFTELNGIEKTSNKSIDIPLNESYNELYEKSLETLSPDVSQSCTKLIGTGETTNNNTLTLSIIEKESTNPEKLSKSFSQDLLLSFKELVEKKKTCNKNIQIPSSRKESENQEISLVALSPDLTLPLSEVIEKEKKTFLNIENAISEKKNENSLEILSADAQRFLSLSCTELIETNTNIEIPVTEKESKNYNNSTRADSHELIVLEKISNENIQIELNECENVNRRISSEIVSPDLTLPLTESIQIENNPNKNVEIAVIDNDEKISKTISEGLSLSCTDVIVIEKTHNKNIDLPITESEINLNSTNNMENISEIKNSFLHFKDDDENKRNKNLSNIDNVSEESMNINNEINIENSSESSFLNYTEEIEKIEIVSDKETNPKTGISEINNIENYSLKSLSHSSENINFNKRSEDDSSLNEHILELKTNENHTEEINENNIEEIKQNHTKEMNETRTEEITKNQIEEIKENHTEEIKENHTKEINENHTEEINENQIEEIKENHTEEIKENQIEEIKENHTEEIKENHTKEINENHTEEINENQIEEIKENHTEEIKENHTKEINENHTEEINENQIEEIKENHTEKVKENQIEEIKENHTEEIKENHTKEINENHTEEINQNQIEEINQNEIEEIKENHTEEINENEIEEIEKNHTKEMNENRTAEVNENHTEEINENHTEEINENQIEEIKENHTEEIKENHTKEINENHTEEINENQIEEIKENHTEEINENRTAEINENHTEEINENQIEEIKENHTEEINDNHTEEKNENQIEEIKENHTEEIKENHTEEINENFQISSNTESNHCSSKASPRAQLETVSLTSFIDKNDKSVSTATSSSSEKIIELNSPSSTIRKLEGEIRKIDKIKEIILSCELASQNKHSTITEYASTTEVHLERNEALSNPSVPIVSTEIQNIFYNKDQIKSHEKEVNLESDNRSLLIERPNTPNKLVDDSDKTLHLSTSLETDIEFDKEIAAETLIVTKSTAVKELLPIIKIQNYETELNKNELVENIKIQQLKINSEMLDVPLTPEKKLEQEISNYQNTPFKLRIKRRLSQCANINEMFEPTCVQQDFGETENASLEILKTSNELHKSTNENPLMTSLLDRIDEILDGKKEKCGINTEKETNAKIYEDENLMKENLNRKTTLNNKYCLKRNNSEKISKKKIGSKSITENFEDSTLEKKELWMKVIGLGKSSSSRLTTDHNVPLDIAQKKFSGRRKKSRYIKQLSSTDEIDSSTSNADESFTKKSIQNQNIENDPFQGVVIPMENFAIQNDNNAKSFRNNLEVLLEAAKTISDKEIINDNNPCHTLPKKKVGRPPKKNQSTAKTQRVPARNTRLSCAIFKNEDNKVNNIQALNISSISRTSNLSDSTDFHKLIIDIPEKTIPKVVSSSIEETKTKKKKSAVNKLFNEMETKNNIKQTSIHCVLPPPVINHDDGLLILSTRTPCEKLYEEGTNKLMVENKTKENMEIELMKTNLITTNITPNSILLKSPNKKSNIRRDLTPPRIVDLPSEAFETDVRNSLLLKEPKKSGFRNRPTNQPKKIVRFLSPISEILSPEKSVQHTDSVDYTKTKNLVSNSKKSDKKFTRYNLLNKIDSVKLNSKPISTEENSTILNNNDNKLFNLQPSNCRPISPTSNSTDSDDVGKLVIDIPKILPDTKRKKKKLSLNKLCKKNETKKFKTQKSTKGTLPPPVINYCSDLLVSKTPTQCQMMYEANEPKLLLENYEQSLNTTNVSPNSRLLQSPNQINNTTKSLTSPSIVHWSSEVDIISLNGSAEKYGNLDKSPNRMSGITISPSKNNVVCYGPSDECQIMYPIVQLCETDDILNIGELEYPSNNFKKTNRNRQLQKNKSQNLSGFEIFVKTSRQNIELDENNIDNKFISNNLLKVKTTPHHHNLLKTDSKSNGNVLIPNKVSPNKNECIHKRSPQAEKRNQRKLSTDKKKGFEEKLGSSEKEVHFNGIDHKDITHNINPKIRVIQYTPPYIETLKNETFPNENTQHSSLEHIRKNLNSLKTNITSQTIQLTSLPENSVHKNNSKMIGNTENKHKIPINVKLSTKNELELKNIKTKVENAIPLIKKSIDIPTLSELKPIENITNNPDEKCRSNTDQLNLDNRKEEILKGRSNLCIFNIKQPDKDDDIVPVQILRSQKQENICNEKDLSDQDVNFISNCDAKQIVLQDILKNKFDTPVDEVQKQLTSPLKKKNEEDIPIKLLPNKELVPILNGNNNENKIIRETNLNTILNNQEVAISKLRMKSLPKTKQTKLGKDINSISNKLLEIASTTKITATNKINTENEKAVAIKEPNLEINQKPTIIDKLLTIQEETKIHNNSIEKPFLKSEEIILKQTIKPMHFNPKVEPIALLKVQNILENNLKENLDSESILGQIENVTLHSPETNKIFKLNKEKNKNDNYIKLFNSSKLGNEQIKFTENITESITVIERSSKLEQEKITNIIENTTTNNEKPIELITDIHTKTNQKSRGLESSSSIQNIYTGIEKDSICQNEIKELSLPLENIVPSTLNTLGNKKFKTNQDIPTLMEKILITKANRRESKELSCSNNKKLLLAQDLHSKYDKNKITQELINLRSCFVDLTPFLHDPIIIKKKIELNKIKDNQRIVDNKLIQKRCIVDEAPKHLKIKSLIQPSKILKQSSDDQKKIVIQSPDNPNRSTETKNSTNTYNEVVEIEPHSMSLEIREEIVKTSEQLITTIEKNTEKYKIDEIAKPTISLQIDNNALESEISSNTNLISVNENKNLPIHDMNPKSLDKEILNLNQNNEEDKLKINFQIEKNSLDCSGANHIETGKALQKLSSMISKIKEITDLNDLSDENTDKMENTIDENMDKSKNYLLGTVISDNTKFENKCDEKIENENNEISTNKLFVEKEPEMLTIDNNLTGQCNTKSIECMGITPSTIKLKNTKYISSFPFCDMPKNVFDDGMPKNIFADGSDNSNCSEYNKITLSDTIIDPLSYQLNTTLEEENCLGNQLNSRHTTKRKRKSRRASSNKKTRLQNLTDEELRKIAETKKCFIKLTRYETIDQLREQIKQNEVESYIHSYSKVAYNSSNNSRNSSPTKSSYESDSDTSSVTSNTDIESTILNVKEQLNNLKDLRFSTNDNVTDNSLTEISPIIDVVNTSFKNSVDDISFVSSFDFSTPDWCSDTILDSITKDLTGHHEYSTNNKGDCMISGKGPENSLSQLDILYPFIDTDTINFESDPPLVSDAIGVNNIDKTSSSLNKAVNMNVILNQSVLLNKQQQQLLQNNLENTDELLNYSGNVNQINPDDFLIPIDNYDISTDVGFDFQAHDHTYDFNLLIDNNNKNSTLTIKNDSIYNNNFNSNNIIHSTPRKNIELKNNKLNNNTPNILQDSLPIVDDIVKRTHITNNENDKTIKFVKEFVISEKDLAEASSSKSPSDNLIQDSLKNNTNVKKNLTNDNPIKIQKLNNVEKIESTKLKSDFQQLNEDGTTNSTITPIKSMNTSAPNRRKSLVELSILNKSINNQKTPEKHQTAKTSESKLISYPTPYWKVKNKKQQSPPEILEKSSAITTSIKSTVTTSITSAAATITPLINSSAATTTPSIIPPAVTVIPGIISAAAILTNSRISHSATVTPSIIATAAPVLTSTIPSNSMPSSNLVLTKSQTKTTTSTLELKTPIAKIIENNGNIIPNCTKVNVMTISPQPMPLITSKNIQAMPKSTPFHMPVLEINDSYKKKKPIINSPNVTIIPKNLPQFNDGIITKTSINSTSNSVKPDIVIDFIQIQAAAPINNLKRSSTEINPSVTPLKRKFTENETTAPVVDIFDQLKNEPPINNVQIKLDQCKNDKNILNTITIPKTQPSSIIMSVKSPAVQSVISTTSNMLSNQNILTKNGCKTTTINNFTPSPTPKTPINSPLDRSPKISPGPGKQSKYELDHTKYSNTAGFNKYLYRHPSVNQNFTSSPTLKATQDSPKTLTTILTTENQKCDKNSTAQIYHISTNSIKNTITNQSFTPSPTTSIKTPTENSPKNYNKTDNQTNKIVVASHNQQQKEPILNSIDEINAKIQNFGQPKTYGQHKQLQELLKLKQLEEENLKRKAELDAKILASKQQQERLEIQKQKHQQYRQYSQFHKNTTNPVNKAKSSSTKREYINLFSKLSENPTSNRYLGKFSFSGQNKNSEINKIQQPLTIPTEWEYRQVSSDQLLAALRQQKK